jgi:hypothetical protein
MMVKSNSTVPRGSCINLGCSIRELELVEVVALDKLEL